MVERFNVSFNNEHRRGYVWLPRAYFEDESAKFPVLYMFDGHNVFFDSDATFGKSWGMAEYMEASGTPLIIVAVECSGTNRLSEYSPFDFTFDGGAVKACGRESMEWLTGMLIPDIEGRYRTNGARYIAGSSMGGLMSIYAMCEFGGHFAGAAALSPSVWVAPEALRAMICKSDMAGKRIYMDYGTAELLNREHMKINLELTASALSNAGADLSFSYILGARHCEADWEKRIPIFIPFLMG